MCRTRAAEKVCWSLLTRCGTLFHTEQTSILLCAPIVPSRLFSEHCSSVLHSEVRRNRHSDAFWDAHKYAFPQNDLIHSLRYFSNNNIPPTPDDRPVAKRSFVEQILPREFLPYAQLMRWDKPSATWLLVWPAFWSIGLAADCGSLPDLHVLGICAAGALVMRGAGCTINDMWDRDLDKKVERTKSRPLAAGTVSNFEAWCLLAAQLSVGLGVLLQLNFYSQVVAASSLSLTITYPLMKRITYWPQAYLGLTMNWGALVGWSAVTGSIDWAVLLPLYSAGVCWTLVYDTIYACQDMSDDTRVGIKSTALRFGKNMKPWLTGFSSSCVLGLTLAGMAADCGAPYFIGVAGTAAHLAWQVGTLDMNNGPDCMRKFASNKWLGATLFAGILADKLLCTPVV